MKKGDIYRQQKASTLYCLKKSSPKYCVSKFKNLLGKMCSLKYFVLLYCQLFGHLKICIWTVWTIYGMMKAMSTLFASKELLMLQNQHNSKERCVVIAMLIWFANKEVHFESILDHAWQQVRVHYESNADSICQQRGAQW